MNDKNKGEVKTRKNKGNRMKEIANKSPVTTEDLLRLKEHFDKKFGRK